MGKDTGRNESEPICSLVTIQRCRPYGHKGKVGWIYQYDKKQAKKGKNLPGSHGGGNFRRKAKTGSFSHWIGYWAKTPEEIAVSIVAELIRVRASSNPVKLK